MLGPGFGKAGTHHVREAMKNYRNNDIEKLGSGVVTVVIMILIRLAAILVMVMIVVVIENQ